MKQIHELIEDAIKVLNSNDRKIQFRQAWSGSMSRYDKHTGIHLAVFATIDGYEIPIYRSEYYYSDEIEHKEMTEHFYNKVLREMIAQALWHFRQVTINMPNRTPNPERSVARDDQSENQTHTP